jgi:hypothetical protein
LSDKVGQELLFSNLTLSLYFSDLSREVTFHHAILSVNGSVPCLELLAPGLTGSLVFGVPVGGIGVDLIVGHAVVHVVVSSRLTVLAGPLGIELATHVPADTGVLSNPLDILEEGLVVVLGLLDPVLLVGVEGEEVVAHGLPAGASELAGHAGELSERVGFTPVSTEDPLVLAVGVGVVGGLLLSHLLDGGNTGGFLSALSQHGVVLSYEVVEECSNIFHVIRCAESLSQSLSLGTVPAGQKGTLFNVSVLGIHGLSNLTDLSLGQIVVTGVAAVGVADAGGGQLAVNVFDGGLIHFFQVVIQVVELELGNGCSFSLSSTGLVNQVHTPVALLNPFVSNVTAGGADGLGVELEEGGAHAGASVDSPHSSAVVSLLASTSVRDVVSTTDFETDISFNADKLLLFCGGLFTVSEQVVLVLELGSNPVLVLFDSIVSLDGKVASLTVFVESSCDFLGVRDTLGFSDTSKCHNGGSY